MLKKTGPAAKAIASLAEAKEFASAADVVVLGLFKVNITFFFALKLHFFFKKVQFRSNFRAISGQFFFRSKLKVKSKVQFQSNFGATFFRSNIESEIKSAVSEQFFFFFRNLI